MRPLSAPNNAPGRGSDAQYPLRTRRLSGGTLLSTADLSVDYPIRSRLLRRTVGWTSAVNHVDLELREGESLGVVGESGCGKSTLGLALLRLGQGRMRGSVNFRGKDIYALDRRELRAFRQDAQVVLQNPFSSLDPRMTARSLISEPLKIHLDLGRASTEERVNHLLKRVGLSERDGDRYPHQFSGGQRQRISIAAALAVRPQLLVLDEPVSALDVSVQAQIVNLLADLQTEFGLSYVFISHNLGVVRNICHNVAVMYMGRVVEYGPVDHVLLSPQHPYTKALISAVPVADPTQRGLRPRVVLEGEPPNPSDPPSGCRFHRRCWKAQPECRSVVPRLEAKNGGDRQAACHYPEM